MPSSNSSSGFSAEAARAIIEAEIFRLRPKDYCIKFPKWPGMVGLEAEAFALDAESLSRDEPETVSLEKQLTPVLERIAARSNWKPQYDGRRLMQIVLEDGDKLTFEPGGQLEYSSIPYPCLSDAVKKLRFVQESVRSDLEDENIHLLFTGVNPWSEPEKTGLQMSKPRYRAMDRYFNEIGPYGQWMMRQTCTIQVNLDFGGDEEMLAKRYLASNLIAPFATAIFAYSPVVNKTTSPYKSYRSYIWRQLDPTRTGFGELATINERRDKTSCVDSYFNYLMDANVVFIKELEYAMPRTKLPFKEWVQNGYEGVFPGREDFETHISLHFPEVRPRGFLELRSVDGQAEFWQVVPPAFYTALLYDPENLEQILQKLQSNVNRCEDLILKAARGYDDPEISEGASFLFELALGGLARLPDCFHGSGVKERTQLFAEHFVRQKRSPADDLLDIVAAEFSGQLVPDSFRQLEHHWQRLIK